MDLEAQVAIGNAMQLSNNEHQIRLIANQALEIARLAEQMAHWEQARKEIMLMIGGVGGPLNDNKLGYTAAQLEPFWQISNLLA